MDKGKKSSRKRKMLLIAKHTILDPSCKCTNDCKKFDDEVKREIHTKYWELSYYNQQARLCGQTTCKRPTRARIHRESRQRERRQSNTYFLPNKGDAGVSKILPIDIGLQVIPSYVQCSQK